MDASTDDPRRMLARPKAAGALLDAVRDLHRDAEHTRFPLRLAGSDSAAESRDRLIDQLSEHLIPRLTELAAPAVVVVAGSTGAGKSTLVNSLVGREVTQAGVLRPTTRRAVLVHHPDDEDLLSHHPVRHDVEVVADDALPRGIAILDAPDLDSVVEENRAWAHRLLESADLWMFVTTATRYGDALPWKVLEAASERGTTIAMVLNRVPAGALPEVRRNLQIRMRERGLGGSPLFAVPDVGPHSGLLDPGVVAPISRWVSMLAGPDRARTVVKRTLHGALKALRAWVDNLAEAVQDQADAAQEIADAVSAALEPVTRSVTDQVLSGAAGDGPVRSRWLDLTTKGAPLASVVGRRGQIRGSARDARARSAAVPALIEDLASGVELTLLAAGERARDAVSETLRSADGPRGGEALADSPDARTALTRGADARESAQAWTQSGLRLARGVLEGELNEALIDEKRRNAATRALGVEPLAAAALAGAAGLTEASELVTKILGPAGSALVKVLGDELVARVEAQIAAEGAVAELVLGDPDLAADAASRLRLRLAVLKELT